LLLVEGTIPIHPVTTAAATADPKEAARRFLAEHPTARLESIGGKIVRGVCQRCGTPVMEDTKGHAYDPETEAYTCPSCNQGDNRP